MHQKRIVPVDDYPQIRRLWREAASVGYVARNQGLSERQVLDICLGPEVPHGSQRPRGLWACGCGGLNSGAQCGCGLSCGLGRVVLFPEEMR